MTYNQTSEKCPVCGEAVLPGQLLCPACGCNIPDFAPEPAAVPVPVYPVPQRQRLRPARPAGLVLCLLSVLLCILGAVCIRSDTLQKSAETIRVCRDAKKELRNAANSSPYLSPTTYDPLIRRYDQKQEKAEKELRKIRSGALLLWGIGAFMGFGGCTLLYLSRREGGIWKW
ncbi:MAG: hypothetical protein IJ060_07030 [Oscillospiraceae bacterium]|nr:hypothetical protein [Oscillospiraceae bacterium]